MNRADYLKHKDLIEAWSQGAEIEQYSKNYEAWGKMNYEPTWDENLQYRIKPVEPKTIVLETWLVWSDRANSYFTLEGERKYIEDKVLIDDGDKLLSTREVTLDD